MVWLEAIFDLDTKQILRWTESEDGVTPILDLKDGEGRKFVSVTQKPQNLISVIKDKLAAQGIKMKFKVVDHWAKVEGFQAGDKPLKVKRTYEGEDFNFDCYVTEELAQLYEEGKLEVGDFVLIAFIDGDVKKPLATAKIRKTW